MTTIWDNIEKIIKEQSKQYTSLFIPSYRIDNEIDDSPFTEGEYYCRLWLVEMRLAHGKEWFFTNRYPVVHSAVKFNHNAKEAVIPYLAGPGFLSSLTKENFDKIIQCNHPLTPLFPYNNGLVELQTGLFSVEAKNWVEKFVTVLGRFSSLLAVPQLSLVLNLAEPVYSGIQDLLDVGDKRLELGYRNTFGGTSSHSNQLRPGYVTAILAEESQINKDKLCVFQGHLMLGKEGENKEFCTHPVKPLDGYSYMLFRIEKSSQQDWESLVNIKELVYIAQEQVSRGNIKDVNEQILPSLKTAIFRSPDITSKGKKELYLKIIQVLKEWGLESSSGSVRELSLNAIMQKPLLPVDSSTFLDLERFESILSGY
jgi:hypothetical protein